jgi:hypothetical protein
MRIVCASPYKTRGEDGIESVIVAVFRVCVENRENGIRGTDNAQGKRYRFADDRITIGISGIFSIKLCDLQGD